MRITILSSAKADLKDGFLFYERQQAGLGKYFLSEVQADIDSLVFYAGIHFQQEQGVYRMLTKLFPYAVYYKIIGENVKIYAVLDCRRDPSYLLDRLKLSGV